MHLIHDKIVEVAQIILERKIDPGTHRHQRVGRKNKGHIPWNKWLDHEEAVR